MSTIETETLVIAPLSAPEMRNIWKQTQRENRVWTNAEMIAVMKQIKFYREFINQHHKGLPDRNGSQLQEDWQLIQETHR